MTAVPVAIVGVLFFVGYTGSFRSDFGTLGDTFLSALGNGLVMLFLVAILGTFTAFVVMVPLGAALSSLLGYDGKFGVNMMLAGWYFLGLCYLCGVVDLFAAFKFVVSLWESIR